MPGRRAYHARAGLLFSLPFLSALPGTSLSRTRYIPLFLIPFHWQGVTPSKQYISGCNPVYERFENLRLLGLYRPSIVAPGNAWFAQVGQLA